MMASDLIAFLTARLDEEEREAKYALERLSECAGIQVSDPDDDGDIGRCDLLCLDEFGYLELDKTGHMVAYSFHALRHNPARALREIEARRSIIKVHDLAEHYCPLPVVPGRHGQLWTPEEGPCWTLHLLAVAYSDHPDYPAPDEREVR